MRRPLYLEIRTIESGCYWLEVEGLPHDVSTATAIDAALEQAVPQGQDFTIEWSPTAGRFRVRRG